MSIDATRWAWQQPIKSNLKIILLSLADRAGENHDCYPSLTRLALDCSLSRSSVIRALNELEKLQLITIANRKNEKGNTSNYYKLLGVKDRHTPSVTQTPPLVSHRHPPSVTQTPPLVSHRHPPSVTQTPRNNQLNNHINHNNNHAPETKNTSNEEKEKALLSFLSEEQNGKARQQLSELNTEQQTLAIEVYTTQAAKGINSFKETPFAYWNWIISASKDGTLERPKSKALINSVNVKSVKPTNARSDKEYRTSRIDIIKGLIADPKRKEQFLTEFTEKGCVYSNAAGMILKPDLEEAGLFN